VLAVLPSEEVDAQFLCFGQTYARARSHRAAAR
jgi:hypothetical protein